MKSVIDRQDDAFDFLEEPDIANTHVQPHWKLLTVDDDKSFQQSLAFFLTGVELLGRPIQLLMANSYTEASKLLSQHTDIAIALLDVVMETDDAGLRLVRAIRELMGNAEIRIVLITGQPGMAPVQNVMQEYDINDYWLKSELSAPRIQTVLMGNLRTYLQIQEVARAKRGLQLIVESSGAMLASHSLNEFSARILDEIARLLDITANEILCVRGIDAAQRCEGKVISATGEFFRLIGQHLCELEQEPIRQIIKQTLTQKASQFTAHASCLYLQDDVSLAEYVVYICTGRPLNSTEMGLLHVFCSNIGTGLRNIALVTKLDLVAYQDSLLHIPNRNYLLREMEQVLQSSQKDHYTLLLVDIDNFSGINTLFGPHYADEMLRFVAKHLAEQLDPSILVARVRADTFALLGRNTVLSLAMIKPLFDDLTYSDHSLQLNISAVSYPLHEAKSDASDCLTRAGISLKIAKQRGIQQFKNYDSSMDADFISHFQTVQLLQNALSEQQISVEYQPLIELISGKVVGLEALARCTLDNGQRIPPEQFIPVAETSGLIISLGDQLLQEIFSGIQALQQSDFNQLRMGINFSALQLQRKNTLVHLKKLIEQHHINPTLIEIELTESQAMQGFQLLQTQLTQLRGMGVCVAIDDFGTGFSSLSYLSQLPADHLKIDKSFVDKLEQGGGEEAIIRSIIQLGQTFGLRIIAEGVETQAQAKRLCQLGCHEAQGFWYAKPMPLTQLLTWLREYQPQGMADDVAH